MRIAYLILAHDNPEILQRTLIKLKDDNVHFYIHIDLRSKEKFKLSNTADITILEDSIHITWGSFNMVEATLKLLNKAYQKKYDYYILMSGVDYPIRSGDHILTYLAKNKYEYINICKMPEMDKKLSRVYYYWHEAGRDKNIKAFINKTINKLTELLDIKREYPKEYQNLTLYAGSQWWALSNDCISYILSYIKSNPKYLNFYKNTYIPDEMFFHTIIGNSIYNGKVANSITYTYWDTIDHIITKEKLVELKNKYIDTAYGNGKAHILFARKFSKKNFELLDYIDKSI